MDHNNSNYGLVICPTNTNTDSTVVDILSCLNRIMSSRNFHGYCKSQINKRSKGIRQLQGDRYEIWVQVSHKDKPCSMNTSVFMHLCRSVHQKLFKKEKMNIKDKIITPLIEYAKKQAKKDNRFKNVANYGSKTLFGNFSIICTFGDVVEQQPHIDVVYPNYQYILMISNDSPGTKVYAPNQWYGNITVPNNIKDLLYPDMDPQLVQKMYENQYIRQLIKQYGNSMFTKQHLLRVDYKILDVVHKDYDDANMTTGTVLSLPGSVIHAGPASSAFRAAMFYSATPNAKQIHNTQYTNMTLINSIMLHY